MQSLTIAAIRTTRIRCPHPRFCPQILVAQLTVTGRLGTLALTEPGDGGAAVELRLTVAGPAGSRDVRISTSSVLPFDTVRQSLAVVAGLESQTRWQANGLDVGADAQLGEPPLIEGVVLSATTPESQPPPPCRSGDETGVELRVVSGPNSGLIYQLGASDLVIGRSSGADLRLADQAVSRRHAVISWRGLEVRVRDLGSSTGTTLDDQPVGPDPVPLQLGTRLRVGASVLVLADSTEPSAASELDRAGGIAVNLPPRIKASESTSEVVLPPAPPTHDGGRFPWLPVAVPLMLSVALVGQFGAQLLAFTALSTGVVALTSANERMGRRRARRRAAADYRRALADSDEQIAAAAAVDAARQRNEAPDAANLLRIALGPSRRLWERAPDDLGALRLRAGTADLPARIGIRRAGGPAGQIDPPAVPDVPVTLSLRDAGVIGLAGDRSTMLGVARFLVAQIAGMHSPHDVRLVVISADPAGADWHWARWLPHLRPVSEDCHRLVGLGSAQASTRLGELRALVELRSASTGVNGMPELSRHLPVVVLICDGPRHLRSVPGLVEVLRHGPDCAVYTICLSATPAELPTEAGGTVILGAGHPPRVRVATRSSRTAQTAIAELVTPAWAERFARALAPLRDLTPDPATEIPHPIRTLDLLDMDRPSTASIASRWRDRPSTTAVLLGAGENGAFQVDLASDGPHALVAGTTGAGKSELLRAWVASLAAANRPDQLGFVLVDYKGGAAFAECAELPHVLGLVTDLDGGLAQRALTSLRAELVRRERVLREAGTVDLDGYLQSRPAGRLPAPLARLVIVVDEFAALIEELPEFMAGLVDIAQRGRSLGTHLVLATQRPAGVVSPEIRANANLRIGLRMTDAVDSQDILDDPRAATISRHLPGRAYVRVGTSALRACQISRISAPAPQDTAASVEIDPWQRLGDSRRVVEPDRSGGPSDLRLLIDAIRAATAAEGIEVPASPWLPPLPTRVTLAELDALQLRGDHPTAVAIGLCDRPALQARQPLWFEPAGGRHWLVAGAPGSGKSTVLRTVAGALSRGRPIRDTHLYGLDCAGGGLTAVAELPLCGAVAGPQQVDRGLRILSRLGSEVVRRQQLLADRGAASTAELRSTDPPRSLPWLVLLLDGWEGFLDLYGDVDHGRAIERLFRLLTDGPAVGLSAIVTGDRRALTGQLAALIANKLVLRLSDPTDYGLAGLRVDSSTADWPPGRGLLANGAVETQVATVSSDPAGRAQRDALRQIGAEAGPGLAGDPESLVPFRVDELPARVGLVDLELTLSARGAEASQPFWLPLGVGGDELTVQGLDLEPGQSVLFAGPPGSGRTSALTMAAQWYLARGMRVLLAGPRPTITWPDFGSVAEGMVVGRFGPGDGNALAAALTHVDGPFVVLVDDADSLVDSPLEAGLLAIDSARVVQIVAGCTDSLATIYRGLIPQIRRSRCGLLLGAYTPVDGELFGIRVQAAVDPRPGRALMVTGRNTLRVQVATP